ncbi:MAG: protein TolR [Gammaproteobacteria bacterium]|nr:MAG: protein TolR [Gammaproteobacteria bacterium]PIE35362.1 MAG: protein TolR [Gammaproteobacteria bacterium]
MAPIRRARRPRRQVAEINVVPYIDVMLVLLVIFMITAPLLRTGVDVDLPDAEAEPIVNDGESEEPLILSVDAAGDWFLNVGEDPESPLDPLEVQRLASAVMRISPERRVLVAGDTSVNYGQVMQAMATLQIAGAREIGLMSEPVQ